MTRSLFTSYDDDGRIVSTGSVINPAEQIPDAGGVVEGIIYDGELWYFDNHVATLRPDAPACSFSTNNIAADGVATVTLSGAPVGALVQLGDDSIIADGGDIQLSTDLIGLNRVIVDAFPAKRWTGEFNGTAA